jgi:hypothetical protein
LGFAVFCENKTNKIDKEEDYVPFGASLLLLLLLHVSSHEISVRLH